MMKRYVPILLSPLLSACAQLPEATGEVAQAVASSEVVTQATEVGKIVNQDVNIPLSYVGIIAFVAWNVRTPLGMITDFLGMRNRSKSS